MIRFIEKHAVSILVLVTLVCFALPFAVRAAQADLTWTIPTTNRDGSALNDLAGFKVYRRTISTSYDHTTAIADLPATATAYTDTNLPEGHYVYIVTAYDTAGNESYGSNEAGKEIKIIPGNPLNLQVQ